MEYISHTCCSISIKITQCTAIKKTTNQKNPTSGAFSTMSFTHTKKKKSFEHLHDCKTVEHLSDCGKNIRQEHAHFTPSVKHIYEKVMRDLWV